jgi:hypothetical protein
MAMHFLQDTAYCSLPATSLPLPSHATLQAALAITTDLDPSVPTIGFLITDAPPHLTTDDTSPTAAHELRFLCDQRGLTQHEATDFFRCFKATAFSHFGSNLILNCVVYNTGEYTTAGPGARPCATQCLYGSLAQQTGGMMMEPDSSRDSSVLAYGLTTVVRKLVEACRACRCLKATSSSMQGVQMPESNQQQHAGPGAAADDGFELRGFKLIDVSGLNEERSCESDEEGTATYGDSEVLFEIAMDRMVAGEGGCCYVHIVVGGRSLSDTRLVLGCTAAVPGMVLCCPAAALAVSCAFAVWCYTSLQFQDVMCCLVKSWWPGYQHEFWLMLRPLVLLLLAGTKKRVQGCHKASCSALYT